MSFLLIPLNMIIRAVSLVLALSLIVHPTAYTQGDGASALEQVEALIQSGKISLHEAATGLPLDLNNLKASAPIEFTIQGEDLMTSVRVVEGSNGKMRLILSSRLSKLSSASGVRRAIQLDADQTTEERLLLFRETLDSMVRELETPVGDLKSSKFSVISSLSSVFVSEANAARLNPLTTSMLLHYGVTCSIVGIVMDVAAVGLWEAGRSPNFPSARKKAVALGALGLGMTSLGIYFLSLVFEE